jgi:xanthine/CO dehydrogenase XdhC/CoxF family maturation factor
VKELRTIIETLAKARREGKCTAIATVVKVTGSAYRREGARMLVTEDGLTAGCVSGGCLDADVRERALKLLANPSATAELAVYDMTDENDILFGTGAGCQGIVEVLIERIAGEPGYLDELVAILDSGKPAILVSVYRAPSDSVAQPGEHLLIAHGRGCRGTIAPALAERILPDARAVQASGKSRSGVYNLDEGRVAVLIEALAPPAQLAIFGAGPGARPLVRLAKEIGWHVTVVDHRPAFASREQCPDADHVYLLPPEEIAANIPISPNTAAVVMTHSFLHDLETLRALLATDAGYIGLLSSRSRCKRLLTQLPPDIARAASRLHAPIGLDIGADNPETIALSILAEIQAVRAGHQGASLCGK